MVRGDDIRCPICSLNLQVLTERKREEHCDACLDSAGFVEPVKTESADLAKRSSSELVEPVNDIYVDPGAERCTSNATVKESEESIQGNAHSIDVAESKTDQSSTRANSSSSGSEFTPELTEVDCKELIPKASTDAKQSSSTLSSPSLSFFQLGKRKRPEGEEFTNTNTEVAAESASKSGSVSKRVASKRSMPFYKTIKLGSSLIAVDAFNYGKIARVTSYFLTHFHADHYGGLTKSWCHGPIYCSQATARLASLKLNVKSEFLHPLELNKEYTIDGINVMLFDANHCPGAVVFLFNKTVLHTGDFRATDRLVKNLELVSPRLDTVYLDTTYLDPERKFPSQDLVVDVCAEYCARLQSKPMKQGFFTKAPEKRRIVVMVGTYTIGKERLALAIARRLNSSIWAQPWKQKVLEAIEDPTINSTLTDNGLETQVHLVTMQDLSIPKLEQKWKTLRKHFTHLVAFVPTGWTWPRQEMQFNCETLENPKTTTVSHGGAIRLCRVPYSEHSSFSELERFCVSVACKNLIATVHTKRYDILRKWETN